MAASVATFPKIETDFHMADPPIKRLKKAWNPLFRAVQKLAMLEVKNARAHPCRKVSTMFPRLSFFPINGMTAAALPQGIADLLAGIQSEDVMG
jgi:hypothetical protein